MKKYNGHKSWNHWNAMLWLSNDYGLECEVRRLKDKGKSSVYITKELIKDLYQTRTPDGGVVTKGAIREFVRGV